MMRGFSQGGPRRTMQTARMGGDERVEMEEAVLLSEAEELSLPAIQPVRTNASSSAPSSSSDPSVKVESKSKYLASDIELPLLFGLTAQSLDIPVDQVNGALHDMLALEAMRQRTRESVRSGKMAKIKVETDGIELLGDIHPRYQEDDKMCRIFQEEQEVQVGVAVELSITKDEQGKRRPVYRAVGKTRGDPTIIKALIALVQGAVGDNEKLFLRQTFCLKRQSDKSGGIVTSSYVVLDDDYQDTALLPYLSQPYTDIERRVMEYTSCLSGNDGEGGRHWQNALESLLSGRNQQDQPFSTRIKLYLINRPPISVSTKPDQNFSRALPYRQPGQGNPSRGVWKSLHIGVLFELYANPAKMYNTPSNIVSLNNRRIVMQTFCPGSTTARALAEENTSSSITLEDFYANLLPAPTSLNADLDRYQPPGMTAKLLPFQKRSVAWLVAREQPGALPYHQVGLWEKISLGSGADVVEIAYNRLIGEALPLSAFAAWNKGKNRADTANDESKPLTFDDAILQEERDDFGLRDIRGGMLCEEMGLGKTLEAIALTMLSRENGVTHENSIGSSAYDPDLELKVTKVSATLIVTPETLIYQWQQEIRQHAPGLTVIIYEGWRSVHDPYYSAGASTGKRKRGAEEEDEKSLIQKWVDEVGKADIVLTTFRTVQNDWDVAGPAPRRSRRSTAAYVNNPRPRSALLLCDWLRVIIDEIQELDIATASKAANMIKTIKRRFSLAISGTPAKIEIEDLASSLLFLGVKIPTRLWKRITTPAFAPSFHAIFKNIAIRHTKANLTPGDMTMTIPRQTRYLVPIRLNRIERAYYKETYEGNVDSLQRSSGGFSDLPRLRAVLHTLRMISTHMQVGQLGANAGGGRAARIRLDGQIMTMMEALQRMEEDAESNFLSKLLELGRARIRQAMLLIMEDSTNWPRAVAINRDVYREMDKILKDLERRISAVEAQDGRSVQDGDSADVDNDASDREAFITILRARKHDLYLLQHEAAFRLGDVYSSESVMEEGRAEKEEEWYAVAGRIREGLLESTATAANAYRERVKGAIKSSKINVFDELEIDFAGQLGLLGSRVQEPLNNRIDALNDNAEFLWNVRGKIVATLLEAIGEKVGNGSNDYDLGLDEQYQLESQMWIYQLAMADRREFMIEERNALAAHEDRVEAAKRLENVNGSLEEPEAPGLAPADAGPDIKEKLVKERDVIRMAAQKGVSLKAAQMDLSDIAARDGVRYEEKIICKSEADRLKGNIKRQTDILKKLADEFAAFNVCFNRRVNYYRALQSISDTVVEIGLETGTVEEDLAKVTQRIIAAKASYDKVNARRRYLDSIRNEDEETADGCPICQESFGERGEKEIVILGCLHRLCALCYKTLRIKYYRPICPTCRAAVSSNDSVQKISYHKPDASTDGLGKITAEEQSSAWLSAHIHPEAFNLAPEEPEMLSIDIFGSWGSKLDRLIRHLHYWRSQEPGVKHIIFSSWKDALTIVEAALTANRIKWLNRSGRKHDDSVQKFNKDPTIQVFLLHGEKENSGLTLTSASVIHLLEPVINSGFEMQAIGRVDRLGQMNETTVYCYAAEGTVEAKIVNRAKQNQTSLYARNADADLSRRNTAVTSVARKGADDLSGNRDDILDLLLN